MATDALDPGPDGDYPYFPRDAQGRPIWSESAADNPDGGTHMPRGNQRMRAPDTAGRLILVDLTPRLPDGTEMAPPVIPPHSNGTA